MISIASRSLAALLGVAAGCMLAASALLPAPAHAQSWPTRTVRVVIPYPAGGSIDVSGRRLVEELATELGQPVIVDNRSGANGIIGSEVVARAAPDGYTLLLTTVAAHAGNVATYKSLPFDPVKDFAPVTVMNTIPLVLVAHPSFPARNVRDLVERARAQPGKVQYASFGTGGMAHLAGVQLALIGGVSLTHVPYKGGAPALADVLGGHVPLFFSGVNSALPHIRSGKLNALALSGTARVKALPDVPTVAETPGFAEYEASVAPAVWAPARTPTEIVGRLRNAIVKVMQNPAYRERLARDGESDPIGSTPEQMAAFVARETERLGRLIRAAGIKPE